MTTTLSPWDVAARQFEAPRRRWATPGQLARALDPKTVQTPALDLIDDELVRLADTPDGRLIISMSPQEGKSQRTSRRFPTWVLTHNPDTRIAIASYEHGVARRWGRAIRDDITTHSGLLGLSVRDDLSAQHEWQLVGHEGGVYAVGIGGALTGRPVDCVSADTYIVTDRGSLTAAEAFTLGISRILAYDHATGRAVWRDVEAARRISGRRVVEVVTESGRTFTCTPDHRVYTRRGYVPAGSLRPGDALVALVGAGGMPVPESAGGAEVGSPQGDPSRAEPLLLSGVHGGDVLAGQPDAVLCLRKPGPTQSALDLLGRVRAGAEAARDAGMPAVRDGVPAEVLPHRVLLPLVRERGALSADDRQRKLALQDGNELRPLVQVHATADSGARRAGLCDLLDKPDVDVHPSRADGYAVRAADTPHRRGRDEQPAGEPHHLVHGVPRRAPQVEPDAVAVVRDRGDETVDVYDFQVAGTRNFFGNGVLVHNCLIIDDPIKDRAQADSPTYRARVWDWWTDVAATRLAPGAPVVLILTRWHDDDLAGRLLAAEDGHLWRVVNIPAQADHDPNKGESDPLGRQPGEFMLSARGRTTAQWEAIKVRSGSRTWASLYQGRPAPAEGDLFHREWWREYRDPRWIVRNDGSYWAVGADEVIQSWDMAFKDTDGSDYVCGQVWARYGLQAFLLDQVHARLSFVETRKAVRRLAAKWPQALLKLVEDKANGTAVINSLSSTVAGLVPEEPHGSKFARASAVAPFAEAGQVFLPAPELAPWVTDLIEEAAAFPNGAHDDQVDAMSQGLNRLLLAPLLSGDVLVEDGDLDDELYEYEISPY